MHDPVELTKRLIACESVTPATGSVFDTLAAMVEPLGFAVHRWIEGADAAASGEGPVENLFAVRHGPPGSRHFAFAGHLDVVPAGEGWTAGAFQPEVRGDLLYGRGAVDMKGAIACMVAALSDIPQDAGTISLVITGDEEGEAKYGTRALMDRMAELGEKPDLILVGEPTSVHRLGDMMKIGRRGSINAWFVVEGREGHVAYPHLADNPLPRLIALLADLDAMELDAGTDWFHAAARVGMSTWLPLLPDFGLPSTVVRWASLWASSSSGPRSGKETAESAALMVRRLRSMVRSR